MSDDRGASGLRLLRNSEFAALAGTAFARSQAYSTILIALALYADLFGTTGFVEGLFGTAFALAQLVIVVPLGRAIDIGDSKRFLLVGLCLNVLVFVGFAFVQSPVHVILMRVLQGVGASLLWITGSTVVGEISPDGGRGRWLGSYNQVGAFSSLAGDLLGGYLLYAHGFALTYAALAAITVGATLLVLRRLRANPGGRTDAEDATGVETLRALLARPMIRALVAFRLSFSVGKMAVIVFLPIFARTEFGITAFAIGGILAGGKLTKALCQGVVGDLTDRLGRKRWFVLAGALTYAVGTALIPFASVAHRYLPSLSLSAFGQTAAFSSAFLSLFAAYGVIGIADSFRLPASMALFVEEGERFDSVASSMSLRSISWKAGQVVGPALVGLIKDAVSVAAGFLAAAGFILVAATVFLVLSGRGESTGSPAAVPGD